MSTESATQPVAASIVLFDFDGVLFKGDAFGALLLAHCARQWWRIVLALPLLLIALPFALMRRARRRTLRFLVELVLLGVSATRYRELATNFGDSLARDPRRFSRAALQALNTHRHAGARVIVVTGCEEQLARSILDGLGLKDVELVASRLAPTRFGMRTAMHNIGRMKAYQLGLLGICPPWDIAYSDSLADLPILAAARSAVLVNANRRLLARASNRLKRNLVVVEW
jgi:phosphatidylglycerophosphatase C